jgi:high-affinity Fe2+/Pb2+ permease
MRERIGLHDEDGSMVSRIAMGALAGLVIGGVVGWAVGRILFGSAGDARWFVAASGLFLGLLAGGLLGWFRGLGSEPPREGPYD